MNYHTERQELYIELGKLVDAWAKADHFSFYVFTRCVSFDRDLDEIPNRELEVSDYFEHPVYEQKFNETKKRVGQTSWLTEEHRDAILKILDQLRDKSVERAKFVHGLYSFDSAQGELVHVDMTKRTNFVPTPNFSLADVRLHVESVYDLASKLIDEFCEGYAVYCEERS